MLVSAVAAAFHRTVVFRITDDGGLEQRWVEPGCVGDGWSAWERAPFDRRAIGVAAISGWDEQIEVFLVDSSGHVWNRWWWRDRGWTPPDAFNPLGAPFVGSESRGLAALSAGGGHFNVFLEAVDGRWAVLPHLPGPRGASWLRCDRPDALGDGWWPAFGPAAPMIYRTS